MTGLQVFVCSASKLDETAMAMSEAESSSHAEQLQSSRFRVIELKTVSHKADVMGCRCYCRRSIIKVDYIGRWVMRVQAGLFPCSN